MAIIDVDHYGINALDKEGYVVDVKNNTARYNQYLSFSGSAAASTNINTVRFDNAGRILNSLIGYEYDGGTEKSTWAFWIRRNGNAWDSNERFLEFKYSTDYPWFQFVRPSVDGEATRVWFVTRTRLDEANNLELVWKTQEDVITQGSWHHVVATIDMSGLKPEVEIYVDAVKQKLDIPSQVLAATSMKIAPFGVNSTRIQSLTAPLTLGANGLRTNTSPQVRNFNGDIDEVVIWDKILTPDQIKQHMDCRSKRREGKKEEIPSQGNMVFRIDCTLQGDKVLELTNNFEPGYVHNTYSAQSPKPLVRSGDTLLLVKEEANLASLSNRLDPYQYGILKQIRTGEKPVARAMRNNNIISVENQPVYKETVVNSTVLRRKSKRGEGSTNYVEPPVSSKYKPMNHTFLFKGSADPLLGHKITHTYANNLVYFSNKKLNNKLGLDNKQEQMYDRLFEMYGDPNYPENENPINKFIKMNYTEDVWPKEENTYLAETRGRNRYIIDQPGYGVDGYDVQFGTQRVFWRENASDRKRSYDKALNSQNYSSSYEAGSTGGTGSFLNMVISSDLTFINTHPQLSVSPMDICGDPVVLFTGSIDIYENSSQYFSASFLAYQLENQGELNKRINIDSYSKYDTARSLYAPMLQRNREINFYRRYDYRKETTLNFGFYHRDLKLLPEPRCKYIYDFIGLHTCSKTPVYDTNYFNQQGSGTIYSTLDEGLQRMTHVYAGKGPWYDSYDEYSLDLKVFAKDYSIIPEFRISENIDYYVGELGGNFRGGNNKFLSIDGGNIRNSANSERESIDEEFFSSYAHSDLLKSKKIAKQHKNIAKLNRVSLTVKGIKKLLPYNGFYPINRTVQLSNAFRRHLDNGAYGGGIVTLESTGSSALYDVNFIETGSAAKKFRDYAALEPFFAPGILFNTIKSGIAVDWPIYTASVGSSWVDFMMPSIGHNLNILDRNNIDSPSNLQGEVISRHPSARIPFETLLEPDSIWSYTTYSGSVTWQRNSGSVSLKQDIIFPSFLGVRAQDHHDGAPNGYGLGYLYLSNYLNDFTGSSGKMMVENTSPYFYNNQKEGFTEYKMAMHNFLSETVKFFLKDGKVATFTSEPQHKWKSFEANKTYYMDVLMKKSEGLTMIRSFHGPYHMTSSEPGVSYQDDQSGKYFGPPSRLASDSVHTNRKYTAVYNNPAYAPYTPPYFEGAAIARLAYTPTQDGEKTMEDIFKNIVIENVFEAFEYSGSLTYAAGIIEGPNDFKTTEGIAYSASMPNGSSLDLFGRVYDKTVTYDGSGRVSQRIGAGTRNVALTAEDSINEGNRRWVISSKFETPVLDFSDQPMIGKSISYLPSGSTGFGIGMWSGYGSVPSSSQGIFIQIKDSYPVQVRNSDSNIGSLLEQVGFKKSFEKVGQLAEKKEISEAIVAIPYLDNQESSTTSITCHNFIKIENDIFKKQRENVEAGKSAVLVGEFGSEREIYSTSISRMIEKMSKYVLPPEHNFLEYSDIDPFVMYIFEFKHVLDQQDLADIWQGVMPKIAMAAEKDEVEFSHPSGVHEFFHGKDLPENLRWMVFKVKKKAEWNYYNVTADSTDDDRFQFNFKVGRKVPEYSYNWPYDYFSLVELGKLEIDLEYVNKDDLEEAIQKSSTQTLINSKGPGLKSAKNIKKLKG